MNDGEKDGLFGQPLSGWRKIATAVWHGPDDPQVFGALELDATAMGAFIDRAKQSGVRVTPTHVVGRAIAHALEVVPELNVRLFGGRAFRRETIDVFFITAVNAGRDLSGVKVTRANEKTAADVAEELRGKSRQLKEGRDPELARSKRAMELLPLPVLRVALRAAAFLVGDLALNIKPLGLHASPFGSAMVSSVGMLGIPMGFSPLAWMYKVPLLVLVGELGDKPVAVDGRVEIRRILPITATIDHRYADGWQIAQLMKAFREYIAAPERFEPPFAPAPTNAS